MQAGQESAFARRGETHGALRLDGSADARPRDQEALRLQPFRRYRARSRGPPIAQTRLHRSPPPPPRPARRSRPAGPVPRHPLRPSSKRPFASPPGPVNTMPVNFRGVPGLPSNTGHPRRTAGRPLLHPTCFRRTRGNGWQLSNNDRSHGALRPALVQVAAAPNSVSVAAAGLSRGECGTISAVNSRVHPTCTMYQVAIRQSGSRPSWGEAMCPARLSVVAAGECAAARRGGPGRGSGRRGLSRFTAAEARHPRSGPTSRSRRFDDSMETGEMDS